MEIVIEMEMNNMFWMLVEILAIILVWIGIVFVIWKKELFKDYITVGGLATVWIRTKRVKFLDRIKQPQVLYQNGSTIGLVLIYGLMILGVAGVCGATYFSVTNPRVPDAIVAPNNILLIPGVTDFVPLSVEVILALIMLVTIHEIAHGILARINNIDIVSAGIIWLVVPVGGFVEPNEEQLQATPPLKRLQVYAAGISANFVTLVIGYVTSVYLISMTTGVSLIKETIPETAEYWYMAFKSLTIIPLINVLRPSANTLWITQNTATWMPTHVEPFFGYWFLLHLAFWMFWISFALVFTNALPLKFTDGGQIFEISSKWALDRINLGRYAAPLSNNVALILLVCVVIVFAVPYIYQLVT